MGGPQPLFRFLFAVVLGTASVAACGGGSKKTASKPNPKGTTGTAQSSGPKTEADRENDRHARATAIVPQGSNCLPLALKEDAAPRLELAAIGTDAVLCAVDVDKDRLLGPVGCWKIDLNTGGLAYEAPWPLPGHNVTVKLEDRCARGYCLPNEAKAPAGKIAHMAWNLGGSKVAVIIDDEIHLFDAATKAHESAFAIRGDKGVTNDPIGVHFVGDMLFVEGADHGPYSAVWAFKTDGTALGPLTNIGGGKEEKPISTYQGSFSILDKTRVGLSERGMETLNTYEVDTGKRSKLVRKVPKPVCKPDELDAYWHDGDKVTDKCKDAMDKSYGHLKGATAVLGSKSFLVVLRGERLGELAVLDAKTLAEKKAIKLPWCEAGAKAEPAQPTTVPGPQGKSPSKTGADAKTSPNPVK